MGNIISQLCEISNIYYTSKNALLSCVFTAKTDGLFVSPLLNQILLLKYVLTISDSDQYFLLLNNKVKKLPIIAQKNLVK